MEGGSLFTNWQEVRVQEQSQGSAAAGAPRSLTVLLQDELADQAQVGGEYLIAYGLGDPMFVGLPKSSASQCMPGAHSPVPTGLRSLWAALHADDVEVTGVVIRQFGPMFPGVR